MFCEEYWWDKLKDKQVHGKGFPFWLMKVYWTEVSRCHRNNLEKRERERDMKGEYWCTSGKVQDEKKDLRRKMMEAARGQIAGWLWDRVRF